MGLAMVYDPFVVLSLSWTKSGDTAALPLSKKRMVVNPRFLLRLSPAPLSMRSSFLVFRQVHPTQLDA